MKLEATEKREITYTLTLTEQQASDLKLIAGLETTVPKALRGKVTTATRQRLKSEFLPTLWEMLDRSSVIASE